MSSLWQKPSQNKTAYESLLKNYWNPRVRTNTTGSKFGLELEVENAGAIKIDPTFYAQWATHEDHSLRNSGLEFVTTVPQDLKGSLASLDLLEEVLSKNKQLSYSDRTSFHVHLNFNDKTIKDWHIFSTVYYLLEDAITLRAGGKERVGNLFCLRLRDSKAILTGFRKFFDKMDFHKVVGMERYTGLNHQAFDKFGTLEVRCHRATPEVEEYRKFLNILEELLDFSLKSTGVSSIFEDLSYFGYADWVAKKLPKTYTYLTEILSKEDLGNFIAFALPLAQEIAFCVDINEFSKSKEKKVEKTPDPSFNAPALDPTGLSWQVVRTPRVRIAPIEETVPRGEW